MPSLLTRLALRIGWITRIDWWRRRGATIGSGCVILDDVHLDPGMEANITIGNEVTIAPRVMILTHDASTKRHNGRTRIGTVQIGDRVFLGAGCLILPGVTIRANSIVGAGSVVTKDVPAGVVVAGNPAVVICTVEELLSRRRAVEAEGARITY